MNLIEAEGKGMSRRRTLFLIVAVCTLAIAAAFSFGGRAQHRSSVAATGPDIRTERVLIAIEGMQCSGCAEGIKVMLKHTAGVISADVSFERKEAVVEYDPEKITPERIVEAINNMGYRASIKSRT